MPRVLLLNPPGRISYIRDNYCSYSSKANYFWEPIDLLVQSAMLQERCELTMLDAVAESLTAEQTLARVRGQRFDAILSLVGSISLAEDAELFAQLKKETGAVVAASGDLTLAEPEKTIERIPALDVALLDYTTPDFADWLGRNGDRDATPYGSLARRIGGRIVPPDPALAPGREFAYPPPPHTLFPIDRYRISTSLDKRFVTCIASLGCNMRCPFCICSLIRLRLRSIDSLLAELRQVRGMGIREIYFYDPHFTADRKQCGERLQAMIAAKLGTVFSCNAHIKVDEDTLDQLKAAGCHTLMFGIENATDEVLQRYNKGITREKIRTTLERCVKRGIRTFGYFLLGLPGESEQTIVDTIRFASELPLNYASFNLPSPVVGTQLYRDADAAGELRHDKPYYDRSTEAALTLPGLSEERLLELKRLAYRRFYLRPWKALKNFRALYPRNKWGYFLKDVWIFLKRNMV